MDHLGYDMMEIFFWTALQESSSGPIPKAGPLNFKGTVMMSIDTNDGYTREKNVLQYEQDPFTW